MIFALPRCVKRAAREVYPPRHALRRLRLTTTTQHSDSRQIELNRTKLNFMARNIQNGYIGPILDLFMEAKMYK